jgi:hypothetical protein
MEYMNGFVFSISFQSHGAKKKAGNAMFSRAPAFISSIRTRKVGFDFNSSLVVFYTFRFSILQIFLLLFFVSYLFSTNPVPAQLFVIVCSSGGLQVFGITQRIIVHWLASPSMEIINPTQKLGKYIFFKILDAFLSAATFLIFFPGTARTRIIRVNFLFNFY